MRLQLGKSEQEHRQDEIVLDGRSHLVIGVMGPDLRCPVWAPAAAQVWTPLPWTDADRAALTALMEELRTLQGEMPMVPVQVDGHTVASIIASCVR